MIFQILFYLLCLILKINCIQNVNDNDQIEPGKTQTRELSYLKENKFSFIPNYENNNDKLTVHLFSINCKIEVSGIEPIFSHNDDIFSFVIENNSINNTKFNISPKVDTIDGDYRYDYQNRNCHLIINSIFNEEYTLKYEEKESTVFYFNKELNKVNILYTLENINDNSFLTFSFIFNEESNFSIIIRDNDNNDIIEEKKIINSTNIFLNSEQLLNLKKPKLNLNILIQYLDYDNNHALVTFKAIEKNSTSILQKNYLNYGFITSETTYQYYYMKIYKGEEGEINLHNKRKNGILLGCISQNMTDSDFPKSDQTKELLKYDKHCSKLSFYFNETNKCQKGCYLLITYFQESFNNNLTEIGYEFTLTARVWDGIDLSPQIINIPFNEYIFGYIEKESITHHYYSLLIPKEVKKIFIQINSDHIDGFIGEGKRKLITSKAMDGINNLNLTNNKTIITYELKHSNNNNDYISFAFRSKDYFLDILSFYYFRIIYMKNDGNDNLILPLDSNVGNLCRPKPEGNNGLYYCYFILFNKYNEFSHKYSVSTSSKSENVNIYSIFKYQNGTMSKTFNNKSYFKFDKNEPFYNKNYIFVLFKFEFQNNEIKNILSSFNEEDQEINLQIYSSQIFHLFTINKTMNFSLNNNYNYSLLFMWINGKGTINLHNNNSNIPSISAGTNFKGKPIFIPLSDIENIQIEAKNNFIFYLKLKYDKYKRGIVELIYGETINEIVINKQFPIYYYIKYRKRENMELNFKISNYEENEKDKEIKNYNIEGYLLEENHLLRKINGELFELKNCNKGIYDPYFKNGLLQINEEMIDYNLSTSDNNYIFIAIDKLANLDNKKLIIDIVSLYKNTTSNIYTLPINQYIIGTFNLPNNEIKNNISYLIGIEDQYNKSLPIIEFSSNYDDIEPEIKGGKYKPDNKTSGVKKYRIIDDKNSYIILTINNPNNRLDANYIIRYYYTEKEKEILYDLNKTFEKINYIDNPSDNSFSITLKFERITAWNGTYINNPNINYKIYGNLFLRENKNNINSEKIETLAIVSSEPYCKNQTLLKYNDTSFNLTFGNIKKDKYFFDLQIKINVIIKDFFFNEEFLVFTLPVDLKEFNKSKIDTMIYISIGLGTIIIIIIIICLIICLKYRKKNIELKNKVLSISFSKGITDDAIKGRNNSKSDENYESSFI